MVFARDHSRFLGLHFWTRHRGNLLRAELIIQSRSSRIEKFPGPLLNQTPWKSAASRIDHSEQIKQNRKISGSFTLSPTSKPYWQNYYPLADVQLSSMAQFLFNNVIATTWFFTLTIFSNQLASWKILEICELCALSTDSQTDSKWILETVATASTGG